MSNVRKVVRMMKMSFVACLLLISIMILGGCAMRVTDTDQNAGSATGQEINNEESMSEYIVGQDTDSVRATSGTDTTQEEGVNSSGSGEAVAGDTAVSGEGTTDESSDSGEETEPAEPEEEKPRYTVVFDPGHGGNWYGACYIGLYEKDITLKVAKYARDYLLENYDNIEVYLTREGDEPLSRDLKTDLTMRCDLAAEVGATCLVSIHFNATDAHTFSGAEVWCSRRANVHDQTFELGECIMKELVALGIQERSVTSRKSNDSYDENGRALDYYAINRYCAARNIPGIIVEQCFMDSEHDQQYITSEEGLKSLGEANAIGVAAYFDILTERAKAEKAAQEAASASGESLEEGSSGSGEASGSGSGNTATGAPASGSGSAATTE